MLLGTSRATWTFRIMNLAESIQANVYRRKPHFDKILIANRYVDSSIVLCFCWNHCAEVKSRVASFAPLRSSASRLWRSTAKSTPTRCT